MCSVLLVQRDDPEAEPIKFDLPHSVAFLHVANCWEVGDWVHVALCRYGNKCALLPSLSALRASMVGVLTYSFRLEFTVQLFTVIVSDSQRTVG